MHDINEQDASIDQRPSTDALQRDTLSDTGVMRILGDYPLPANPGSSVDLPMLRSCPVCTREVPDASTVCKHCLCYVGPSPDYLRSLQQ